MPKADTIHKVIQCKRKEVSAAPNVITACEPNQYYVPEIGKVVAKHGTGKNCCAHHCQRRFEDDKISRLLTNDARYNCLHAEYAKEVCNCEDCCPELTKHPDAHHTTVSNQIHSEVCSTRQTSVPS